MTKAGEDGWIAWGGGEMPVDGDTLVEIRLRNGEMAGSMFAKFWEGPRGSNWWRHESADHANDIIAYRMVQP